MTGQRLTFDVFDEASEPKALGGRISATIGLIAEFDWHIRGGASPSTVMPARSKRSDAFRQATQSGELVTVMSDEHAVGFVQTLWGHETEDSRFFNFCMTGEKAATRAGFGRATAQKLIGALRELEDNIHLHSERPESGLLGFAASRNAFEFVVADKGVGILGSLHRNNAYRALPDDGAALDAAVREGVSRFGEDPGHGNGFRSLLTGLYNLNSFVRFRSGDYVLTWNSKSGGQQKAILKRTHRVPGFIIFVSCCAQ